MSYPARDWPRCVRCAKPGHPDRRVVHEGKVYCSPSCVEALTDSVSTATLRAQVLERDKGKCLSCSLDCLALRAEIDALFDAIEVKDPYGQVRLVGLRKWESRVSQLVKCGFDKHAIESHAPLWEMDHDPPLVQGGRNVLSGVVTKCLACHKAVTAELARGRAALRRPLRRSR